MVSADRRRPMPTRGRARYGCAGQVERDDRGVLSEIAPKIARVRAVEDVARAEQDEDRARSRSPVSDVSERDDDRRDDEHGDDRRPWRRRAGASRPRSARTAAEQARRRAGPGTGTGGTAGRLVGQAGGRVRRRPGRARRTGSICGTRSTIEQGDDQPGDLGQRVVGPGERPREVQRQDAVALVTAEQLGRLGGAEQHHQGHADEPVVGLVPDRRGALERIAGTRLGDERRDTRPRRSPAGSRGRRAMNGAILARPPRPIP